MSTLTIRTTNHIAAMANLSQSQKQVYCIDQAIAASTREEGVLWAAKARQYEKLAPTEVIVSGSGFSV